MYNTFPVIEEIWYIKSRIHVHVVTYPVGSDCCEELPLTNVIKAVCCYNADLRTDEQQDE